MCTTVLNTCNVLSFHCSRAQSFLRYAVPAGVALVAATVCLDSLFWDRWLWPEGEVLWFNTILNRSSDYGVRYSVYGAHALASPPSANSQTSSRRPRRSCGTSIRR